MINTKTSGELLVCDVVSVPHVRTSHVRRAVALSHCRPTAVHSQDSTSSIACPGDTTSLPITPNIQPSQTRRDFMAARGVTTPQSIPSTPKRSSKSASSQSLNHLLNFSLPPRQTQQLQALPRRSRRHGVQHPVWNKESECPILPYLYIGNSHN